MAKNIFLGTNLQSVKFKGFTNWYKCIDDPSKLNTLLTEMKHIFYWATNSTNVHVNCLLDPSIDLFKCEHWTEDDEQCSAFSQASISALVFLLLTLLAI